MDSGTRGGIPDSSIREQWMIEVADQRYQKQNKTKKSHNGKKESYGADGGGMDICSAIIDVGKIGRCARLPRDPRHSGTPPGLPGLSGPPVPAGKSLCHYHPRGLRTACFGEYCMRAN